MGRISGLCLFDNMSLDSQGDMSGVEDSRRCEADWVELERPNIIAITPVGTDADLKNCGTLTCLEHDFLIDGMWES